MRRRPAIGGSPIRSPGDGPGVVLAGATAGRPGARARSGSPPRWPALSEEALQELRRDGERTLPLGTLLHFANWHETYHVGQTELLRALAGKTDKVI